MEIVEKHANWKQLLLLQHIIFPISLALSHLHENKLFVFKIPLLLFIPHWNS